LTKHGATLHCVGPYCAAFNFRCCRFEPRNAKCQTAQTDETNRSPNNLATSFLLFELGPGDIHRLIIVQLLGQIAILAMSLKIMHEIQNQQS
jgi:hypothetical protein